MEKARAARTNLVQAIRLKNDESSLGCSSSRAEAWMTKKDLMYNQGLEIVLPLETHWNMVAGPGTHSYTDVMPSVVHTWQMDMGAFKLQYKKFSHTQDLA